MNWLLWLLAVMALICIVLLFQIHPRIKRLEEQVGDLSGSLLFEEPEEEDKGDISLDTRNNR